MNKLGRAALAFWVFGTLVGFGATFGFGWVPLLGSDHTRVLSATLLPKPGIHPSEKSVEEAMGVFGQRTQRLGLADANVARSGKTLVVQLPSLASAADLDRAEQLTKVTAKLEFRKVLAELGPEAPDSGASEAPPPGSKVITGDGGRYLMGPVEFDNNVFSDAMPELDPDGSWAVIVQIKSASEAEVTEVFNSCYSGDATCPPSRRGSGDVQRGIIGMVLDGEVISAPTVDALDLPKNPQGFWIVGGLSHGPADSLASDLRFGALPFEFEPVEFEPATLSTAPDSLGARSLHAGMVAGMVGLLAVVGYVIGVHRAKGRA